MIAFDYKEAMAQAQELEDISRELKDLSEGLLRPQLSELGCAWKGSGASLFLKKTDGVLDDITRTAKTTAAVGTAVEVAAKAIKAAEEAAKQAIAIATPL